MNTCFFQLNQQSHSESEVKEDDDHETAGSLNAQEQAAESKDAAARRKKKKKRKKPGKLPTNARSSEDNIEVINPSDMYFSIQFKYKSRLNV